MITTTAVRDGPPARLDGADVDAVEIDTDPFVCAIGFTLREVVVTAVLPRDDLTVIDRSLVTSDTSD